MDNATLRKRISHAKIEMLKLCSKSNFGHPSSACSCADIVGVLLHNILVYGQKDNNDTFVISKNHGSVIVYPFLLDLGLISRDEYDSIMVPGSKMTNQAPLNCFRSTFYGMSLGIGFGISAGMAKAAKLNGQEGLYYCLVGDCECNEGSIWETAMFAGHNKLDNLIVIVDYNNMGVSDYSENMICMEPLEAKWSAFGFETMRISGHDLDQINNALSYAKNIKREKPFCLICDTLKGKGIDFMENKLLWHGTVPNAELINKAIEELEEE